MSKPINSKMAMIYKNLAEIGFSKQFVRDNFLPDWWDKDCEKIPEAVTEAAIYISRRLNLELNSLLDTNSKPEFKNFCQPKFKVQQSANPKKLSIPHCFVSRIAELAAYACLEQYDSIENLAIAQIRNHILKNKDCVDLEGLLEFCWSKGIPVVHFAEFPRGMSKFHGMVAKFNNRPVIIVSLNDKSSSRLLFIIAHELGHIYKKHISETDLVDKKIELESDDIEEIEANNFAVELLSGKFQMNYDTTHNFNGKSLATYAFNTFKKDKIDPGVVAWNYGWKKKHWGVTADALKIIEQDVNAPRIINSYLTKHLEWDKLSYDNQEYLASMTKLNIDDL